MIIIALYTIKNRIQFNLEIIIPQAIQAKLLIEEKARIFWREVKFISPSLPTIALKKIDTHMIFVHISDIINKGIIFCHVLIRINLCQPICSLTSGNQKKTGNIPSLVNMARDETSKAK